MSRLINNKDLSSLVGFLKNGNVNIFILASVLKRDYMTSIDVYAEWHRVGSLLLMFD